MVVRHDIDVTFITYQVSVKLLYNFCRLSFQSPGLSCSTRRNSSLAVRQQRSARRRCLINEIRLLFVTFCEETTFLFTWLSLLIHLKFLTVLCASLTTLTLFVAELLQPLQNVYGSVFVRREKVKRSLALVWDHPVFCQRPAGTAPCLFVSNL